MSQTSRHVEMVCVCDFPVGEVSVKVGVMEFGLELAFSSSVTVVKPCHSYWLSTVFVVKDVCGKSFT